jgi:hypothetical protein
MARNPSLHGIRMICGRGFNDYAYRPEHIAALENTLLKDAALRSLVQIEYPQTTAGWVMLALPLFAYFSDYESRDAATSTKNPPPPPHSPSFVPLQSAPNEVKETVWGRVICFAMLQEEDYILEHQYFNDERRIGVKLQIRGHHILQVSKMFNASPTLLHHILDS